jgi:hypothetical protein
MRWPTRILSTLHRTRVSFRSSDERQGNYPCLSGEENQFTDLFIDICHIAGTYSTAVGATSSVTCTPCNTSPGFSCPTGSSSAEGILCPAGFYCEGAARDKEACPTNATSPTGSITVTNCSCNAGSWGPPGSNCTMCPSGTFSAAVGATDNSTCQECPAGTFSPGTNSSESVRNHPCCVYIYWLARYQAYTLTHTHTSLAPHRSD